MSSTSSTARDLEILLNGRPHQIAAGTSYAELVVGVAAEARMVAVERNGEILPRARWAATPVVAGDRVEVVRFVQGG